MFLAWIWRIIGMFVVLTLVYIGLSLYNRWAERRRLSAEYARREEEEGAPAGGRKAFVDQGMYDYERSLRRKLVFLVYLIPFGAIAILVALAQL